ncbi:MAG TPA: 2-hydroxyacid dehydrogenase [Terriglobales bacterium]|nr:2-hydroxyacid dehydrogenase [Terriglobales bacterium]
MRVLFCGDTFPAARALLHERLPNDELCVWLDRNSLSAAKDVDVLIPMMFRIDAGVMSSMRPRLIQQWGSGLEGIDLETARNRGIPVTSVSTSGSNAESVAEHALLLILALFRQLPLAQCNARAGTLGAPLGRMLAGRALCFWGLGQTALSLARRLRALDVKLLGITRDPRAKKVAEFGLDACYSPNERGKCLSHTDVLVLCIRLNNETRGLVDTGVLAEMRRGAYLVNTARGALIDYHALYSALCNGRLAGAGLDVFWEEPMPVEDPLLSLPNVIATPHVAGVTDRSYEEIADAVAANVERLRHGEALLNRAV